MDKCIFCEIVKGNMATEVLASNSHALAFRDANPQASTHILVIPKIHISSTRDLNLENISSLKYMALLANEISDSEGISENGYRWIINTGKYGGQSVFHLHLHLIGGRKMKWPPG